MASNRISVATIDSPEFINITSISPLVSKCEVKVLYIGGNRNRSYISKEVATEMAQTLPGCPIVGYYIENKEDFGDHGDQIIIDNEGVKFKKLTQPYGFVAPDSKVWFQKFEEYDDFGNPIVREYLMTEGYIWTGQYEEAKRVISEGNPQSMELDEKTLKGYWSEDYNKGVEFFIINDAIFSKLCILGEDVEPCFEGANITAPNISTSFSKDDNFTKTLFSMLNELKFTLSNEGGQEMVDEIQTTENSVIEQPSEVSAVEETKNFSQEQGKTDEIIMVENQTNIEEFKKSACGEDKKEKSYESKSDDMKEEEEKQEDDDKEDDKKIPAKNSLIEENVKEEMVTKASYDELQTQYSSLKEEYDKLVEFKTTVENEKKDELIASFSMLSDEDKADVITNKANYSLDEIEAKLSVICVRKKVSFSIAEEIEKEEVKAEPITYNLNNSESDNLPAWLKAVEKIKKDRL